MRKYIIHALFVLIPVVFISCLNRQNPKPDDINHYIYDLMHENYLWYKEVPSLSESSINGYKEPELLLEYLKYQEIDKWSYVQEVLQTKSTQSDDLYQGYGFIPYIYSDNKMKVAYVYKNTDAWAEGIRRGDIIELYNGILVEKLYNYDDITFYSDNDGDQVELVILKPDNTRDTVTLTNKVISMDPILVSDVLDIGTKKAGYLAFDVFGEFNNNPLAEAIDNFKAAGVDELILDLRYNGGGAVNTMENLVNSIVPVQYDGDVAFKYVHNDKYSGWDETAEFDVNANNLNLNRVFVIVSGGSASASELLISCLLPYMDVKIVGKQTHGKPVGMYVFEYEEYEVVPICFSTYNATGYGEYYDGIAVDYEVSDDVTHQLGDVNEEILSKVSNYISTGSWDGAIASKSGAVEHEAVWGPNRVYDIKLPAPFE